MFFILYAFFLRAAPRYFAIFVANEDEKETKLILLDKIEKKQTNSETGRRKQSGTRVVKSGEDCHGFQMTKNLKIRVEFFNAQILNSYF